MLKYTIAVMGLVYASQASAGFLDSIQSFFSGDDETTAIEASVEKTEAEAAAVQAEGVPEEVKQQMQTKTADMSGLVGTVVSSLGVSNQQAMGGLGAIFGQAQSTLPKNKFDTLAQYVPNMTGLLSAVPAITGQEGALGKVLDSDMLKNSSLSSAGMVLQQFDALGLNKEMIGSFVEIAMNFLKKSGGVDASSLLQTGIQALI